MNNKMTEKLPPYYDNIYYSISIMTAETPSLPLKEDITLKFIVKKFAGEGSQFVNYKVIYNGNKYLLKIQYNDKFTFDEQINIYKILNVCNIPHKLYFNGYYQNYKVLCYNYISGIDLFEYFLHYRRNKMIITESFIMFIIKNILLQLAELNKNNIIHLDIKPENILINLKDKDKSCNLIDFGLSKIYSTNSSVNILGSKMYIAPEIINNIAYHYVNDIWSLGVTIYEIIYNSYPYNLGVFRKNKIECLKNAFLTLTDNELVFPYSYSNELKNIISLMLTIDYTKRLSAQQLLDLDYIKNFDLNSFNPSIDEYYHYKTLKKSAVLFNKNKIINIYNRNINISIKESHKSLL